MTYSIVARCPDTGVLGVAVQSHFFGVGRMITHAEAGVGAIATQSFIEPSYGSDALRLLRAGRSAQQVLTELTDADAGSEGRQVAIVDAAGAVAVHTGARCISEAGHEVGEQVSAQANLMQRPTVWGAMIQAYGHAGGTHARRLLEALDAAEAEGGDLRGRQSAAMLVVEGKRTGRYIHDVLVDIRVDDHPDPLAELRRLLDISETYGGLLRLFDLPGVLAGDEPASDEHIAMALAKLDSAQRVFGDDNLEPSLWSGVILMRAGRPQAAWAELDRAARDPGLAELIARLRVNGTLPAASPS